MPNNGKPLAVQESGRRVHRSNAEKDARREREAALRSEYPAEPPEYLSGALAERFLTIRAMLMDVDERLCTALDEDVLARYVIAEAQYLALNKKMDAQMKRGDMDEYAKIQRLQNIAFKQVHDCATAMGLTLSSRMRIELPKAEEKKANKFSDFE